MQHVFFKRNFKVTMGILVIIAGLFFYKDSQAKIIFQENFNGFTADKFCGSTGSNETNCDAPSSNFTGWGAESKGWDGVTPPYINGIVSDAGRGSSGRGWRINLRAVMATNYENILNGISVNSEQTNPVYLRWYGRENWKDFRYSSYEKLFRLTGNSGNQILIPEWMGDAISNTYFRLWLSSGGVLDWTNFKLNNFTDSVASPDILNKWMCYELKIDITNNKYEFFVNGASQGEKSATSSPLSSSERVRRVVIGGNQNNIYDSSHSCWTPTSAYKTRDYDDIILSDSYVGCDGTTPSSSDVSAPTVPANLTATAASQTQINLSWTASADNVGVTGYKIFRDGTRIGTSQAASYSDSGLSAGITYTYTVSAYDAVGNESAQTSSSAATTLAKTFGISDFTSLVSDWLKTATSASDINKDGTVNSRDLGIMMSKWAS